VISALIVSLGIGFVTGLRSMTAPAVVSWAAHLGWMNLTGSPIGFMASRWSVVIFTILALGEFIADLLPSTPARTTAFPLIVRIIVGLGMGACVAIDGGFILRLGVAGGAIGAIAGTFGGYQARVKLVAALHVPDIVVAIPEDLIAVGLGLLLVSGSYLRLLHVLMP
jgi:uncharacterized membrane protein